ncbi:hypothetical protein Vadar_021787 [Vaccinium darrowii]|uniref:Uncharacterized protein n=1 Tax=Vaccinium darrowii TaxID=229202 RepID=A0ACB7YF77_9ERIC|nr:hypothetical protein Vadar_021787 [Vaccinium darrowii]
MAPTGFSLLFSSPTIPTILINNLPPRSLPKSQPMANTITTSFGFKNLTETFTVDVQRAEGRPLNVPLIAPFTIASSRLDKVENVAIRIELSNGCAGWGEAPILPSVTAEDQATALAKVAEACGYLKKTPPMTLGSVLREVGGILPGHQFASVSSQSKLDSLTTLDFSHISTFCSSENT